MAKDISIREANAKLCEIGNKLRAGDFTSTVVIATHDSFQVFDRAIAKKYGPWLLLLTEHQGYFLQHEDEVTYFRMAENTRKMSQLDEAQ